MNASSRTIMRLLACSLWFAMHCPVLIAQEVEWRFDYNQARREANETGKPILIDFGTANCYWCKQLDATTFRDPKVVGTLKQRYVALKIDANRNAPLTEALRVQAFPTLVLAGPDGKILGSHEGYVDAARLQEQLQRVLNTVADTQGMTRDYQEASKAIAAADYARALGLLKNVIDGGKDGPVAIKARQLQEDLEQQADSRLARGKTLAEKGEHAEARETIAELTRSFPGTRAAVEGSKLLAALSEPAEQQNRVRRARELLAQARDDFRTGQYLCSLDRCDLLAANYIDLPEGNEAMKLAADIKSNPERMRQACETLSDRLGSLYLALAETWLKRGQPQQAVLYLERIVQTLPNSRHAEAAEIRLTQIQGQPTRSIDFKRP